jgi:hypothetical protein
MRGLSQHRALDAALFRRRPVDPDAIVRARIRDEQLGFEAETAWRKAGGLVAERICRSIEKRQRWEQRKTCRAVRAVAGAWPVSSPVELHPLLHSIYLTFGYAWTGKLVEHRGLVPLDANGQEWWPGGGDWGRDALHTPFGCMMGDTYTSISTLAAIQENATETP